MTLTATTFRYNRAIAFKARYAVCPRQKREPADYEGVPPELWLHVFSFLKDDNLDLTSLTIVSKPFAALAQPLLFQHITIRPICGQHPTSGRLTCRIDCLEWVTERMQFSTQERIAHAVTLIEFSPTINYARRDNGGTEVAVVADVVIRMLPLFPRLRSFHCAHLVLQPQHLSTMSGMTNRLRSFHATNCHLSDNLHDHTCGSPMEEFTMAWQGNTVDLLGATLSPHSHQRWFSFMDPGRLRILKPAPLDAFLDQMLADLVDRNTQFHALRSLSLQPFRKTLSSTTFFFLETSTGVSVSRVSGWDPSGFPEKMGYHEFTGAGVAGGSLRGSLRGLTDSSLSPPHQFLDRSPLNTSSLTVRATPKQAG